MALNPRQFSKWLVVDSCSIWNMLSSQKLYGAANSTDREFNTTSTVLYECLYKPRKSSSEKFEEIKRRLRAARDGGGFVARDCDLEDLEQIRHQLPSGLSSGEISCIASAKKSEIAVMTDDRQARHSAESHVQLVVETTPKLYAWLQYEGHLTEGDHSDVVKEHEIYERRPLTKFFEEALISARACRSEDRK